ncbi:hypothetical protein evm_014465 [Chilo suppressalis]|nr:hypothetical protein evm_014465 [Chilo suppressalis]
MERKKERSVPSTAGISVKSDECSIIDNVDTAVLINKVTRVDQEYQDPITTDNTTAENDYRDASVQPTLEESSISSSSKLLEISNDLGKYTNKKLNDNEKRLILDKGPLKPPGPFPKDPHQDNRSFSETYYVSTSQYGPVDRFWICYSKILDAAYCQPCWLFASQINAWCTGIRDWRHLSDRVKQHGSSKAHTEACAAYEAWQKSSTIDRELEDEIRKEASFWRQVLRRLFDIIITLAKSSLALRGHREDLSEGGNHGNFLSIVQLVARYDHILSQVLDMPKAYKHSTSKPLGTMINPKKVDRPMVMLSMDLIGILPKTYSGHKFILSVVDVFTKYCWLFPLANATTRSMCKFLEKDNFLKFGCPKIVVCDNGTEFTSRNFVDFLKGFNIDRIFYNTLYTPQNNPVERYNKTVETCISCFVRNDHRTWSKFLPHVQLALNSSVNLAMEFTPNFLMFGRELIVDASLHRFSNSFDNLTQIDLFDRSAFAHSLSSLESIFVKVTRTLFKAYKRNAYYYNKRREVTSYDVGDIVWRRNFVQSSAAHYFSAKLAPKFIKCKIIDKISNNVLKDLVKDVIFHTVCAEWRRSYSKLNLFKKREKRFFYI